MNPITRTKLRKRRSLRIKALASLAAFVTLIPLVVFAGPAAAQVPDCQSSESDPDGDGWGWENNQSCRVTDNIDDSETTGGTSTSVEPVDDENTVTFNNLREVRDADVSDFVKDDFMEGRSFSQLTAAQLDAPFDFPQVVELDEAARAEAEYEAQQQALADSGRRQVLGWCSKEWREATKLIDSSNRPGSGAFADGFNISQDASLGAFEAQVDAGADIDGTLNIRAEVHYRYKWRKCIRIPYRYELDYADIDVDLDVNGRMSTDVAFTVEYRNRLLEWSKRLWADSYTMTYKLLTVELEAYLDLTLALDLEAAYQVRTQSVVNERYTLSGYYRSRLRCTMDGCVRREAEQSDFDFGVLDSPAEYRQETLDVTLTPSADFRLGLNLDAGVLGIWDERLASGHIGLLAELPTRLHWTRGNACSDADGDGINEDVSVLLVDVNAQIGAYYSMRFLNNRVDEWVENLGMPSGWIKRKVGGRIGDELLDATTRGESRPVWTKHVYFKTLREGANSPIQPVIGRAGVFDVGQGEQEGLLITGPRQCYPFADDVTYEIDWSQTDAAVQRVSQPGFVAHDWSDDGTDDVVRVRIVTDAVGRQFNSPWVSVSPSGGVSIDGYPVCQSADSDSDGDGWGWERNQSCRIVEGVTPGTGGTDAGGSGVPVCQSEAADPDGDGWGWENDRSCQVTDDSVDGSAPAVVSMGDSFISGEGGRWAGNSNFPPDSYLGTDRGADAYLGQSRNNGCHRSDVAEIHSADIAGRVAINLACSGALAEHVIDTEFKGERPQVDQLADVARTQQVDMIVLSIGGNDLGFPEIVADCIGSYLSQGSPCWRRYDINALLTAQDGAVDRAGDAIAAIRQTMEDAGQTDYRLVLQSYPSPMPRSSDIRYASGDIHIGDDRSKHGCGAYDSDLDWVRDDVVPAIDSAYRRLAAAEGAEFLSLSNAFEGKEACGRDSVYAEQDAPGSERSLEWVRSGTALGIIAGHKNELFHPNAFGQRALGHCLSLTWERQASVHTCTRVGAAPESMRVTN